MNSLNLEPFKAIEHLLKALLKRLNPHINPVLGGFGGVF